MVDQPITLTYDDLLAVPLDRGDVTLSCVSNEVGGDLVGNARWLGVPLADLLDAGRRRRPAPTSRRPVGRRLHRRLPRWRR